MDPDTNNVPTRPSKLDPKYFAEPFSMYPLNSTLKHGLAAPGLFGLLSVLSCTLLLGFITYRFIFWKRYYKTYIGYNQYVLLIINLLVADLQQGMGFLISFHWINVDGILAPTRACFAQGWLIEIGDVSSGLFVFFIAIHTFYCAVKGRRLSLRVFYACIAGTWAFALLLSALGPLMYREKYFVRAGAWCWASSNYENDRLALHYIWVFIVQFGTIIIYAMVLLHLKKTMSVILPTASQTNTYAKIDRATKLMILYPATYIVLTLPLSAGRMWSMAHQGASLPDAYYCVAGALLSMTGFVDVLLYTLTRKQLIAGSQPESLPTGEVKKDSLGWFKKGSSNMSTNQQSSTNPLQSHMSFAPFDGGITQTRTVTVTGQPARSPQAGGDAFELAPRPTGAAKHPSRRRNHSPTGSLEPIMQGHPTAPAGYMPAGGAPQGFESKHNKAEITVAQVEASSGSEADETEQELSDDGGDEYREEAKDKVIGRSFYRS